MTRKERGFHGRGRMGKSEVGVCLAMYVLWLPVVYCLEVSVDVDIREQSMVLVCKHSSNM